MSIETAIHPIPLEVLPADGASSDYPIYLRAVRMNFESNQWTKTCPRCKGFQDILRIEIRAEEDGTFTSDPIHVHICPCGEVYKTMN